MKREWKRQWDVILNNAYSSEEEIEERHMAEMIIEFQGAGFIPGVPGEFANCQVVFDEDTKEVLRVEPLGGGLATGGLITTSVYRMPNEPQPDTSAQPVEQATETENQGG